MTFNPNHLPGVAARFVGGVFGFVFFGIGLTVLGFLWLTPFNTFGSPPLFFRLFGSFIAVAFVAMGGTTLLAAIIGKAPTPRREAFHNSDLPDPDEFLSRYTANNDSQSSKSSDHAAQTGYQCDSCAAPLGDGADVSPHGDVKCSHCGRWYNVYSGS